MGATDVEQALRERFGFAEFRPGQREIVDHLMSGRSAAAVFATGAGKSLCYQLPATLLPGLTVVVSPLIALMNDQIEALAKRGVVAHKLDSTLTLDQYRNAMADLRSGRARLLYVAPERFNNERFRRALEGVRVSLFAIDEAHCISEWGHNFRPDYLKLAAFARRLGAERVLALTATATDAVLDDICASLDISRECAVRTPFYRPNLRLAATVVAADQRDELLASRLRERPRGATIVYVTLQKTAERVAEHLDAAGFAARPYHAGMATEARTATQDWFMASADGVVVATIAFGMGVDKADIRYIYHYNLPKSLESYSQEIGRAGRDGAASHCEMLACVDDCVVLENFVYGDTPAPQAVARFVDHLFSLGDELDLSQAALARELDMRPLVLRTLLTYLELRGYLEARAPFYSVYELQPRMSSAEILTRLPESGRGFARAVMARAKKARTWFHIDVAAASHELGVDRHRVVELLDHLAEHHLIELRSKGVRHRYRVLEAPSDPPTLAADLYEHIVQREAAEVDRLRQVLALIGLDGCQASALGAHFSQPLDEPCGHCTWCETRVPVALPAAGDAPIDEAVWRRAETLRAEHPTPLSEPRSMAKLLCGLPSPELTRARLHRHELFGAQANVPFADVLRRAS